MAIPAKAQNYLFTDTLADGQVLYFDTLNGEARVVRPGTGHCGQLSAKHKNGLADRPLVRHGREESASIHKNDEN